MNPYTCDAIFVHEDTIKEVQMNILKPTEIKKISKLYKAISDPTRIKILYALKSHELCVCDISVILNMSQSLISHQLKILKDEDLVRIRKDGKTRFYRLADNHVQTLFTQAIEHISDDHDEENI
jgi:DNA-binding transcriptional ArsR family regulator